MRKAVVILTLSCGLAAAVIIAGVFANASATYRPLATVGVADGRLFHVEGVSYGTNHVIGARSPIVDRFGRWLPQKLRQLLSPKRPQSRVASDSPVLVVWVNATDPVTGKQVDCQGVRLEFQDKHDDLFGEETSSWFGGNDFWRVGHVFNAFPRSEPQLTLQIIPWHKQPPSVLTIPNPNVITPKSRSGRGLPQVQRVGDLEIRLANLTMRTNGSPENYWETSCRFLDPKWELRKDGTNVAGWDDAEWMAEDDAGNRSHFLGVHQPALRFSAMFYPSSTNRDAALLITNSPPASLLNLQSIIWWSIAARAGTNEAVLLGLFPSGTHVFSEGIYQTNPPVTMGPVQGGARSGWVSQSQRLTPFRVKHWHGHYTPSPVIYLRAPWLPNDERWGVRLRDEKGGLWLAKTEPQKGADGILPFLVDLPPEVETVVAELVVLRPLHAVFDVATARGGKP